MVRYRKALLEEAGLSPPNAIANRVSIAAELLAVMQFVPPESNSVVVAEGRSRRMFVPIHDIHWPCHLGVGSI